MSIRDWPDDERPREKLLQRGAAALSDAELLAIFLRVGVPGRSAVDLARDMLKQHGGLRTLLELDQTAFCATPGLGVLRDPGLGSGQVRPVASGAGASPPPLGGNLAAWRRDAKRGRYSPLSDGQNAPSPARSVRRPVSGQQTPRDSVRRTVLRHYRQLFGASEAGGETRALPQRRRRDRGPQPPLRHRRAQPRRRNDYSAIKGGAVCD